MHVRTARTLALSPTDDGIEGTNFLQGTTFTVDGDVVALLDTIRDWTAADDAVDRMGLSEDDFGALLRLGLILIHGTPEAVREGEFESGWRWGHPAAALHFSLRDRGFVPVEVAEREQVERAEIRASPPLTKDNADATIVSMLPRPSAGDPLLTTMARRRTIRESTGASLPLRALSDMLFAGLGVTGRIRNAAGELPLGMTPSGGARNPYEAYVHARRVDGLVPGVHHYSARDHTLGLVSQGEPPSPSEIVGSQPWVDDAAAVVLLVAHLDRTMWKYEDPNAYRVVLIEAGHIGQNMMLVATEAEWSACPSAAIDRTSALRATGLRDELMIEPVYALALMNPPGGLAPARRTDG